MASGFMKSATARVTFTITGTVADPDTAIADTGAYGSSVGVREIPAAADVLA